MTGYNRMHINFNWPTYAENQKFRFSYMYNGQEVIVEYTCKTQRIAANQVTIGIGGAAMAQNFISAFIADYGHLGFTTQVDILNLFPGAFTIVAPYEYQNPLFEGFVFESWITTPNMPQIHVGWSYVAPPEVLNITNVEFSESDVNKCSVVKVLVATNIQATNITSPIEDITTTNPIEFSYSRASNIIIRVNKGGLIAFQSVTTPPILDVNLIDISINNTPFGGNINIQNNINGLDLEYSLDGENFITDNFFNGLLNGNFTLYVRDQFGCLKSKSFTIDLESGIYIPYFYISKSNSIRYAYRVNFGDAGNYKTDENTLSYESDVLLPYCQQQLFQSADIITTQFKSNYAYNRAFVILEDGTEIEYPVIQHSSNIGIRDKRDARIKQLADGKSGVYFESGSIYNPITNDVVDTYTLNGMLPEFGKIGNWISVNGAYFQIENVIFDEELNADMLLINYNYQGAISNVIVDVTYNRFEYEVFEFTIDMVDYIDQKIKVKIIADDENFTQINLLSEVLNIKVKHEETIEIKYFNNDNNDVFYQTGIKHLIRIPYNKISGKDNQSNETYKTDTTVVNLNSEIYEVNVFMFEPQTLEIWRKLKIALSCENVTLDSVGYVKNSDFETEGPLGQTNLYVLTAEMIKTGNVQSNKKSGYDFEVSNVEVPGLINATNDYLRYN